MTGDSTCCPLFCYLQVIMILPRKTIMKYFFFDIDGTLTDIHTGKLVESGLETLRKLEANGHFVAIATGRAYYKTIKAAHDAGIHNFVANGGAALVINDELVKNSPLDREKALTIIHEADDLRRDCRTDICAEYNTDRLIKCEEPRTDKTDRKDDRGGRALDHAGDEHTEYKSDDRSVGDLGKGHFHGASR